MALFSRHGHYLHQRAAALLCSRQWASDPLWRGRRPPRLRMGGLTLHILQARVAGLDAASANAQAPSRSAASHGGRHQQSAGRPRHVSFRNAIPHSWLQRAGIDWARSVSGCIRMTNEDVTDLYDRVRLARGSLSNARPSAFMACNGRLSRPFYFSPGRPVQPLAASSSRYALKFSLSPTPNSRR